MDRSQLRQLTLAYARGDLETAEYHRQRGELIDDITTGRQTIERIAPEIPSSPLAQVSNNGLGATSTPQTQAVRPAFVAVGILVLIGVIWLLYPTQPIPVELRNQTTIETPSAVNEPVAGPGQHLITEFLYSPDWSDARLQDLTLAWSALTDIERTEAVASGTLSRFTRAIRNEVAVQQEVYELSDNKDARESLERLSVLISAFALGHAFPDLVVPVSVGEETLNVAQTTPSTANDVQPDEPLIDATATTEQTAPTPTQEPSQETKALATASNTDTLTVQTETPHAWLDVAPVNGYAVQLFALSSAEAAQKVVDSFPDLALQRIALPNATAGHRVMLGTFNSHEDAVSAYRRLPKAIAQVDRPPVRPIQALRAQLADTSVTSIESLEQNRRWLASQIANSYSLQLFAINDDRQVSALISSFPELDLRVHFSGDAAARFRILHGSFDTPELAAAAFETLPSRIRAISTQPIVTRFEDLQDSVLSATR